MTLIDGIGDEVTHFFIGLIFSFIIAIAWWTTSISDQRYVQTVWLLDRRRHRTHRRLTNHTHTITVSEGTITDLSIGVNVQNENPTETMTTVEANKPPENNAAGTSNSPPETNLDLDRERIVEVMDGNNSVLRQRRLAFYERGSTNDNEYGTSTGRQSTNEEENENEEVEDNYTTREPLELPVKENKNIRIKLKYINDDLKLVNGKLEELLGDFKKRHFQDEISSNKLVRLIFNGQVLQQDSKTLQGYGLFDNCVVHCLIHQRRQTPNNEAQHEGNGNFSDYNNENILGNINNNNNQIREWDLGNFLLALISFILLSAWYFRYVYAHLYTVTATVGLILMTGMFSFIIFGAYFPDHEHPQQNRGNIQS